MGQVARDGSCYGTVPRVQVENLRDMLPAVLAKSGPVDVYMHVSNRDIGEGEHRIVISAWSFDVELTMRLDCD